MFDNITPPHVPKPPSRPIPGKPVIEVYRARGGFAVKIGGVEIPRIKTFSFSFDNSEMGGVREVPSYTVTQYLPKGMESTS